MKKHIFKYLILIISFIFCFCLSFSQSLNIYKSDGKIYSFDIEKIQKITFEKEIMKLSLKDGNLYQFGINLINKYEYSSKFLKIEDLFDEMSVNDVNLFPNPFSDELNLRMNLLKESEINILIFDSNGFLIKKIKFERLPIGIGQNKLDLNDLSVGSYLIRLISDGKEISKRIIKIN